MRRFNSYGPVTTRYHFCVPRQELVDQCINQLVGVDDEGGHYFTIWAARQTGKTWLIHQVMREVPLRYGEQFAVLKLSFGELDGVGFTRPVEGQPAEFPLMLTNILKRQFAAHITVASWDDFQNLFSRTLGVWDRPLLLLIDEVDIVPRALLDMIVRRFREMYLQREHYWLHGLALGGVRAVIGAESERGSPFNVQRSLHVPNLTADEVRDMYEQYQTESGQAIEPTVVEKVYDMTRGQPGLVSWFGMLLTETYNPGPPQPIGMETWETVWTHAQSDMRHEVVQAVIAEVCQRDMFMELVEVCTQPHISYSMFHHTHMLFTWYGIIEPETIQSEHGMLDTIIRFTSPYMQVCVFLTVADMLLVPIESAGAQAVRNDLHAAARSGADLPFPAVLARYSDDLAQVKAQGQMPWTSTFVGADASNGKPPVGPCHLYAWLRQVLGTDGTISLMCRGDTGTVCVHVQCQQQRGVIEVKSFVDARRLRRDRVQAAAYATQVGLNEVTMAVFIPMLDADVLTQWSGTETHEGIQVHVVMIGWL